MIMSIKLFLSRLSVTTKKLCIVSKNYLFELPSLEITLYIYIYIFEKTTLNNTKLNLKFIIIIDKRILKQIVYIIPILPINYVKTIKSR